MWKAYPFEPGEVACAKTSPNFVDSIWELFGPLLAGVKTAFIPEEVAKSPHDLVTALAEHRVTRLVLVPSLLSAMLDSEPDIAHRLPNLKFWISSGEALNLNLIGRLREMAPGRVLLNLYGSSEASADVTCYDIREMPNDGPVLIGKPIANTEIYILDKHLHPVPIGVAGQLCVSGAGLASGYLNRPGLSAEKFIADPFSVDPFGVNPLRRLYLTGDLARYRSDGNIELLGRIDRQVKIRGIRVEPEEVEEALRQHPSVAQAVVVPRNVTASETKLVAYIVQKAPPREHNFVQLLRQYASEQMPEPMIPSAFVVLPDLPLLLNGKIDRHSLPEPDSPTNTAGLAEPSNSTERCILQIWREVLQIESVGTHENFFDLGGHSLLLTAVQNKLSKVFNRQIVSIDLYRYPTISSLAKRLDDHALESRPLGLVQECAQKQRDARRRKRPTVALRVE
jgi:acyl-coenzyme A synthetase/AMP-(fatty) acid ligase